MNAMEDDGSRDVGVASSRDQPRPTLWGRKSVLLGLLTSMGLVATNAVQPSAGAATVTYAPRWAPSTAYVLGQQVISPSNDVVSAKVAHTSSAAFATDRWKWLLSSSYAQRWAAATAYAVGQQVISPSNDVASANVAHVSSAAFATDKVKWTLSSTARGGSQPFGQGGAATLGSSGAWMAPFALVVTRVVLSCVGAPMGSPLEVAFTHNGVTFATCTIPAGSTATVSAVATRTVANLGALSVTATSVGSTTAATDIVAQVDWVKS